MHVFFFLNLRVVVETRSSKKWNNVHGVIVTRQDDGKDHVMNQTRLSVTAVTEAREMDTLHAHYVISDVIVASTKIAMYAKSA